jgi:Rab guanine nucleotide exchange factor SEC2
MTADVVPRSFTPQPSRIGQSPLADEKDLTTLPDPRSRALSPVNGASTDAQNSELDDEVATLSAKLINAINHQTNLDDSLSRTRMELESAYETIRKLEEQVSQQRELLAGDVWVRRKTVDADKSKLLARVAEEKRQRLEVEEQKRKIEGEVESLTAALFEEANKMVVTAKEEAKSDYDALQKRNDQLKAQLADTEGLLRSQQDQLAELKQVMEQMSEAKDEPQHTLTAPSSPGFSKFDHAEEAPTGSDGVPAAASAELFSPSYPTSFTSLLQPVLRTDLAAFEDFKTLIRTSKRLSSTHNRVSTGSSGLNSLGLALGAASSSSSAPSNGSTTSLTNGTAPGSWPSPQTPGTPGQYPMSTSLPLPALKETKFYKRALAEDIEPTMRLDIAPGLSWLARRTVLTAMTEGTLVVEPAPAAIGPGIAASRPHLQPCSLCGESRKDEMYLRTHRFRTSESESAQRYPLCRYCLSRVRSTCDFLGFLRVLRDGLWRGGKTEEDSDRAAWEEGVRLREQMFWSRIGGGVVPVGQTARLASVNSPRLSQEGGKSENESLAELTTMAIEADKTAAKVDAPVTIEAKVEVAPELPPRSGTNISEGRSKQRDSTQSLSTSSVDGVDEHKRLSLTIPPTNTKH